MRRRGGLPQWLMWGVGLVPIVVWGLLLWYSQADEAGFMALTAEDSLVENAQFLLFGLGMVLSARISWRLRRLGRRRWALVYGLLALALCYLAGEEVSWGQRVFKVSTPAWLVEHNSQEELNLHNLPAVHRASNRAFNRSIMTVAILSMLAWLLRWPRAGRWQAGLWMPHPILLPSWWTIWSYQWVRKLYRWHYHATTVSPVVARLHESRELIFSFAIVAFLCIVLGHVRELSRLSWQDPS